MRLNWTDELIKERIMEVVDFHGYNRMPTMKEIEDYYGNTALVKKIGAAGGFEAWANKLGLSRKPCESVLAVQYEKHAKKTLEEKGFNCELTSVKHPYDILVNGGVKIDVKVSNLVAIGDSKAYTFNIEKKQPTCDLYVAYCLNDNKEIAKTYIIPAPILTGKSQLSVGVNDSKYDAYLDNWNLIKLYDDSVAQIISQEGQDAKVS